MSDTLLLSHCKAAQQSLLLASACLSDTLLAGISPPPPSTLAAFDHHPLTLIICKINFSRYYHHGVRSLGSWFLYVWLISLNKMIKCVYTSVCVCVCFLVHTGKRKQCNTLAFYTPPHSCTCFNRAWHLDYWKGSDSISIKEPWTFLREMESGFSWSLAALKLTKRRIYIKFESNDLWQ